MPLLSVVIISRNEEQNITRCIESVLLAVKGMEHEIILVDSASTDNTIEIAKQYPIKIFQLKSEWMLSAAAGRYTGYLQTKGKYIQFQDGDTILDKDWFKYSLPFLKEHTDVAGVVGIITQEYYDNVVAKRWVESAKNQETGEIEYYEEDILLRKKILDEIGPFNPHLKALEEGELSYRILAENYKLVRLPNNMSHHLGGEDETVLDLMRRKKNFSIACGQILRYSLYNQKILGAHWKDYKYIISFSFMMLYGIPSILLMLAGVNNFILLWLAGITLLFFDMVYENDPIFAIKHSASMFIRWHHFLKGFLIIPKKIDDYPIDIIVIKSGGDYGMGQ
ncbi:glycosyltransferase [Methanolobus sp. ZRKC3]|uniref:glycosyltransferase n=1 Tax=Methanolobus sp. ZRKC3 TaxID=3125786 RepID=UPI0032546400